MTPISREIAGSERTLQSWREVAVRGCIPAGNRVALLQFGVVTTTLFRFVRPRFKVIGNGQPPATLCRPHRRARALTGRVGKSTIKWNCRRNRVETGMQLTPREFDKLMIYMVAEIALKRKAKGIKL